MLTATRDQVLPTTIIGSVPRPQWYTVQLGQQPFRLAMANALFREQYVDAVSSLIRDQERAGLDIVTDGDSRFDSDVGGGSWMMYPARRLSGTQGLELAGDRPQAGAGTILAEIGEARPAPIVVGRMGSYAPVIELLNGLDCDVITFENADSGCMDLEAVCKGITTKKIALGVISHRSLQVEQAEDVAAILRRALEHVPPERLVVMADRGFGREGMSRRVAFFKMVAMVQGTNLVRRELGLPEKPCPAAEPRLGLT